MSSIAVDITVFSQEFGRIFEGAIVANVIQWIKPDETVIIIVFPELNDEQTAKLAASKKLEATAYIANALDLNGSRFYKREAIGPARKVFWPYEPVSLQKCE